MIDWLKHIEWKDVNATISALAFLGAAIAGCVAALRAGTILEALREFNKGKSDLRNQLEAVERLDALTPKIKNAVSDLGEDLSELRKPAQPAQPEQVLESAATVAGGVGSATPADGVAKWQEMRDIWREVRDKIESRIENINDGRRRRPYNSANRSSYENVIRMLQDDGYLHPQQAEAAQPKDKSSVGDEEVQNFRTWKTRFDDGSEVSKAASASFSE